MARCTTGKPWTGRSLSLIHIYMIYPVLMACAIGERFGVTGEEMKAGIEAFVPVSYTHLGRSG